MQNLQSDIAGLKVGIYEIKKERSQFGGIPLESIAGGKPNSPIDAEHYANSRRKAFGNLK